MAKVLVVAVAVLVLAGCGGRGYHDTRGAKVLRYDIESRLVGRSLRQTLVVPPEVARGRPLLVLLHGRGGNEGSFLSDGFFKALKRLDRRAPVVLIPSGGKHSYFHDRVDGRWGSYIVREAIPAALRRARANGHRIAIGGISMGGFGAFDLARLHPRVFCAVGGHAAAMWFRGADTPDGAFDDAEDFARHDVLEVARRGNPYREMRIWIDVGRDDPFRETDSALAQRLRRNGGRVTFRLHGGGHGGFKDRMGQYLSFYASALADCR